MPSLIYLEIRGTNPTDGLRYPYFSLQGIQSLAPADPGDPLMFDLVIYVPTTPLGPADLEIYRVRNVGTPSYFPSSRKLEMRGKISSFGTVAAPTLTQRDAWVELRINGRVYANGEDYSAIDPLSDPSPCVVGTGNLNTQHAFGWQVGTYWAAPGSANGVQCVYLDEHAAYCYEAPMIGGSAGGPGAIGPGDPCPPPGPGGSSFDGVPDGIRFVARGGYPASYNPPTGEGVPATDSDETDPQLLSAITTPIVSLDLTLVDASVYSFAKVGVVRSGALESTMQVVSWGDVPYPLSDRFGNLQAQTWEVDLTDPDGLIRGWLASGANRFYKRWEGHLYIEDDAARLAGTLRRSLVRGRCTTVRTDRDLVVTVVFSDEFSRHDSPYSLDRELPHVLIGEVFSAQTTGSDGLIQITDPTDTIASRPIPIIYGEASDEYLITLNPPVTPIGICRLHYVGNVLLGGVEEWHAYVICLYAVHTLPALFGSNLHPECPASVRLDPSLFFDQFLVPGWGTWNNYFGTTYIDLVSDGVTTRTTMIFGRGPISQAHVDGKVPLSCNVCGIEVDGDGTGDLIDDAAYVVQHLLDHPILRGTRTGTWGALAAFPDGVAKIKSSDFAAVKALHDARVASRYQCAVIIDERRAARDWLADILVSADMRIGLNHHGQVTAVTKPSTPTLTSLVMFTDAEHVQDGSFRLTSELNAELENSLAYEFGPEPASGRVIGGHRTAKAKASITSWGDTYKAQPLTFVGIYRKPVAKDVAGRRLAETKDGITRGEFVVQLPGGEISGGQFVRLTHFAGLGTTGWPQRLVMATQRVLRLNEPPPGMTSQSIGNWMNTLVTFEDQQTGYVAPAGMVGGGVTSDGVTTGRIGFNPVGTTAGADGWLVGTDAAGNGWTVG